jgi:excisionase family DNA binding protein
MSKSGHNPETPQASEVIRTPAARPARETRATRPLAPWPEWLNFRQLTEYCGVSERTARSWIHSSGDPLPAVRVGGKVLVRKAEFDSWLERHRIKSAGEVDAIVREVLQGVTDGR